MNEQFLSRNQNEVAQVIISFRELQSVRDHYVLYLGKDGWEVFDPNTSKAVIHHSFKHLYNLIDDIKELRRAIVNVSCIQFNKTGKPDQVQTFALKRLKRIYSDKEILNLCHYEPKY